MRRSAIALALVAALCGPAAASAYPTPSGLNPSSYTTLCPPRPADLTASASGAVIDSTSTAGANAWTYYPTGGNAGPGGPASVQVNFATATKMTVTVQVQNGSGTWQTYWSAVADVAVWSYGYQLTNLPAGPTRVGVYINGASGVSTTVELAEGVDAGANTLQQELADACYRGEQKQADELSSLGDLKDAIQALTANGTTLDSLLVQLQQLHTDLGQLDTDVQAIPGGGGGGTTTVAGTVQLSSADRQLSADGASNLHGDLWVIVGVILGVFCASEILKRVFP